jgi:hypothetical protein
MSTTRAASTSPCKLCNGTRNIIVAPPDLGSEGLVLAACHACDGSGERSKPTTPAEVAQQRELRRAGEFLRRAYDLAPWTRPPRGG